MNFIIRLGDALMLVVWAMVLAYIVMSMLPIPYSRASSAIRNFLDQTVGPVLAFFRRFIPPLGPIDLSPMIALLAISVLWRGILRPILAGA
ncbi:MAG: YggT family protein [Gaiellaceae bacterium]|nr:YggT family protein [Gaiellaceae bacterium]